MVPEIYDEVIERLIEASKNILVGDAMDEEVFMGPVISTQAKQRIENYIQSGIDAGAKLVLDGRNPQLSEANKNGYFVGPTIFTDVTPCMEIAQSEIFGPVLSVMKIADLDDALEQIRKQPTGNGACLFTQNMYSAEKFMQEADVGMVGINVGICAPHPYLPFGGIKDSLVGNNKVQGKDGFDFFTQNTRFPLSAFRLLRVCLSIRRVRMRTTAVRVLVKARYAAVLPHSLVEFTFLVLACCQSDQSGLAFIKSL